MKRIKLSVVLATRNEETNIEACLDSVKNIADEIIVIDENSSDKTREIAKKFGAKVYKVKHEPIFHKTKQKGKVFAFFIPRRNYFLGKPLIHAGVYPDGQIRLVKKDKARFRQKAFMN